MPTCLVEEVCVANVIICIVVWLIDGVWLFILQLYFFLDSSFSSTVCRQKQRGQVMLALQVKSIR